MSIYQPGNRGENPMSVAQLAWREPQIPPRRDAAGIPANAQANLPAKLHANLQAELHAKWPLAKNALKTWPTSQTSPT
jgi:hypothetical protein